MNKSNIHHESAGFVVPDTPSAKPQHIMQERRDQRCIFQITKTDIGRHGLVLLIARALIALATKSVVASV
jgi:hypothetical protein